MNLRCYTGKSIETLPLVDQEKIKKILDTWAKEDEDKNKQITQGEIK